MKMSSYVKNKPSKFVEYAFRQKKRQQLQKYAILNFVFRFFMS